VVLLDVVAGAESQQLLLLHPSAGEILHLLQTGSRVREGSLPNQFDQIVIFSGISTFYRMLNASGEIAQSLTKYSAIQMDNAA
jgi:hypothetical protein